MKIKFALTNIFLQVIIALTTLFLILTQTGAMRQPTKGAVVVVFVIAVISTVINIVNYAKSEKE